MILYKGEKFTLVKEKCRLPTGYVVPKDIIIHPGATLIIPFLDKNHVVLLHQYRPVLKTYLYELPAGTLSPSERPINCARRELVEETGYAAKKFTKLGRIFPVPAYSTEVITIYRAEKLYKKSGEKDLDEIIDVRLLDRSQIRRLFRSKKIVDAKTISAFALCGWL